MPSTVIRAFRYQSEERLLHVTFQSGRRYVYRDVPEEIYRGMQGSSSRGEYFNTHIRDRYEFVRNI